MYVHGNMFMRQDISPPYKWYHVLDISAVGTIFNNFSMQDDYTKGPLVATKAKTDEKDNHDFLLPFHLFLKKR